MSYTSNSGTTLPSYEVKLPKASLSLEGWFLRVRVKN